MGFDLAESPTTFLLHSLLDDEGYATWTRKLEAFHCPLVSNPRHAHLFLTATAKERRALKELEEFDCTQDYQIARLDWVTECVKQDTALALTRYVVYARHQQPGKRKRDDDEIRRQQILTGAMEEGKTTQTAMKHVLLSASKLRRDSTLEEVEPLEAERAKFSLPPYACERETPLVCANEEFVQLLSEIKLARVLALDEIGVRAYSSSIAAIRAYPRKFITASEIRRLPGCNRKMVGLLAEFLDTNDLSEVQRLQASAEHQILKQLYQVHGIGATTARHFYFDRRLHSRETLVAEAWDTLTREQQIGLTYFDDFQVKLQRCGVEAIGKEISDAAVDAVPGTQSILVGGYRRGKLESNDVDIILSHPDSTVDLLTRLLRVLEGRGSVVHTITLHTAYSDRGGNNAPYTGDHPGNKRHGFDSLDKALTVWKSADSETHRRVDIIIAPWEFFGTAIIGWTGGTTFERDLRRLVKHRYALKFDSSGVYDRRSGLLLDMAGMCTTAAEIERYCFEKLHLPWIEPELRNTG